MNQVKAGKLIAKLRKEKGLTQSELGEMVGVGDRAVSKWERGVTFPNVAIINELSEILGISSNELLDGELYDKSMLKTKKNRFNIKKLLIPILIIISLIAILFIAIHNKSYVYDLVSDNNQYLINGTLVYTVRNTYVTIDLVSLKNREMRNAVITNYEYVIYCGTDFAFRKGYVDSHDILAEAMTIEELLSNLKINFNTKTTISRKQLEEKGLILKIVFVDENNNIVSQNINMSLHEQNKK